MKTFRDLVFRGNDSGRIAAFEKFDSGFAISVVAGGIAYSTCS